MFYLGLNPLIMCKIAVFIVLMPLIYFVLIIGFICFHDLFYALVNKIQEKKYLLFLQSQNINKQ